LNNKVINLNVNGVPHTLEIECTWSLLKVLRDTLGLTGPKHGCDGASCGACTVLIDNKPILSCITLAVDADGRDILTIEGLAEGDRLHPIQEAFIEHHGMQCGFCTSGMIMSAKALLDEKPKPMEEEVKEALKGNLCRCGNYHSIVKSVLAAAEKMSKGERSE